MANQLKVAHVQAIKSLLELGWSQRSIAEALGIHRETVRRYVRLHRSKQATAQAEETADKGPLEGNPEGVGTSKPTTSDESAPSGEADRPESRSKCAPYRKIIEEKLEQGLSAQRIWQDLVREEGFPYAYDSVKRFVRTLKEGTRLPYRRLETPPGMEMQVDFGQGALTDRPSGRARKPHVLRLVLSFSRRGYSEAVWRQTSESFLRTLEDTFHYFGGVPETVVIDNLKAAVHKADWFDPDLHPIINAFAEHYGFAFLPTRPRTPRHKGKVERGVDYVQENALKGRRFASLAEQNEHLWTWEKEVADVRIHGTTRARPIDRFELEKDALQPLPAHRFAFFVEGKRKVSRDGHVEVRSAFYSVPPEYTGHTVWARWDAKMVRILNRDLELIASHTRGEKGTFNTDPGHIASEKIALVEKGAEFLLKRVRLIGQGAYQWGREMLEIRGIAGVRVLQGLLSLADKYPRCDISAACGRARTLQGWHLRAVKNQLQVPVEQPDLEFVEKHPLIRSMDEYGEVVFNNREES